MKLVIEQVVDDSAYKIAWQSRRFWEQYRDEIYGCIPCSLRAGPISLVWYPGPLKLMSKTPRATSSGYAVGKTGSSLESRRAMRCASAASRAAVENCIPGKSKELEKPIYMSWDKVPYIKGSGISRGPVFPVCCGCPFSSMVLLCTRGSFPMIGFILPETTAVTPSAGGEGQPELEDHCDGSSAGCDTRRGGCPRPPWRAKLR